MAKIRVNPPDLLTKSGAILSASVQVASVSMRLVSAVSSAPSYEGQFGPQVRAAGAEAASLARKWSNRVADSSASLIKKANAFLSADAAFVSAGALLLNSLFGAKGTVKGVQISATSRNLLDRYFRLGWLQKGEKIPSGYAGLIYELNKLKSGIISKSAAATQRTLSNPSSPLGAYRVSGDFGWYTPDGKNRLHQGADLVPSGHKDWSVHPIGPGVVMETGHAAGGYGNYVVVEHSLSDGKTKVYSRYAHLENTPNVGKGDLVSASSKLGAMGDSGMAKGANHLHLEVYSANAKIQNYYGITENNTNYSATLKSLENGSLGFYDPVKVIKGDMNWRFVAPKK